MNKKLINLQMPLDMIADMKAFAEENGLTISMLIRIAVKEYLKNNKEK